MKATMKATMITLMFAAIIFGLAPASRANEADKKVILTFPQPVEIPGRVLQPGDYVFERVDNRYPDILKVENPRENHLYAMVMAFPIERMEPTGNVVVEFDERPTGQPEALHAIYYPGDLTGERFVYPNLSAAMTASAATTTLAENTNTDTAAAQSTAVVQPEQPLSEESKAAEAATSESQSPIVAPEETAQAPAEPQELAQNTAPEVPPQPTPSETPATLPHTASPLGLLLLIGAAALSGGTGLKSLTKSS